MARYGLIFVLIFSVSAQGGRAERGEESNEVFQSERMLTIRISMTADRWQMMQPVQASRLAVAMAARQHPTTQEALALARLPRSGSLTEEEAVEGARRSPGLVGNEYAYVRALATIDDESYADVGVRFKGQWSYTLAGASPRRPLKIDFNRFVRGGHFHGIKSLSLNTNALDPSQLRESLGYGFFREAGVAAPRTCFALVYLTVDGVYKNELLGLYTVVEEVNEDFLYRHFGTTKGLLIRPERTRNLAYFGNCWEDYSRYNIQTEPTAFTAGRFMDFTRSIHVSSDEYFCSEIASALDADRFLRFLAANVLMVNLDGVLVNGHNFYVHVHPKTGRLTFIPWDLHLGFGWQGRSLEDWVSLTIERPYRSGNRLVERVLSVGWMREMYEHYLREFATTCFSPERMHGRIERLEQVVRKAEEIARGEGRSLPVSMPASVAQPRADLKPFVTGRVQHVLDQLAGRVTGEPVGGRPQKPAPPASVRAKREVGAPRASDRPAANVPQRAGEAKPQAAASTRPAATATPVPGPATAPGAARPASQAVATTRPVATGVRAPKAAVPAPRKAEAKPTPPPTNAYANFVLTNIDANRDGQITREELCDAAKHLFIAHAWVSGGEIDEVSLAATLDYIGRLLDPFPASNDDRLAAPDPLRARPALTWAGAIMRQAISGANQRATLDDLVAAAERQFDAADANGNKFLDLRELSVRMDEIVAESQSGKQR